MPVGRDSGHSAKPSAHKDMHDVVPGRESHSAAERTMKHHPVVTQSGSRTNPEVGSHKHLRPGHKGR
jgi:hypothetical protein